MTGPIEHESDFGALVLIEETIGEVKALATDPRMYDLALGPEQVFAKNWSDYSGFAAPLKRAGIIVFVGLVLVGPFSSLVHRDTAVEF